VELARRKRADQPSRVKSTAPAVFTECLPSPTLPAGIAEGLARIALEVIEAEFLSHLPRGLFADPSRLDDGSQRARLVEQR
jgi:hypothetical protein